MQRRYVPGAGADETLVWYEGAGASDKRWLMTDARGSVASVTNGSGAAIAVNRYDEFGAPHANNLGRFQFTGQMHLSGFGLYHYKARAYHPGMGRFLQPDPIGYGDGMNMYAYVGNDPVNMVDPTGLFGNDLKKLQKDDTSSGAGGYVDEIIVYGRRGKGFSGSVGWSRAGIGAGYISNPGSGGSGGSSSGVEQTICTTTTASRAKRFCATVTTDERLTNRQKNQLAGDFRGFLLANDGADLSDFGISVIGNASSVQKAFVEAISQFVGYALNLHGGAYAHAWSQIDVIRASTTVLSVFAAAPFTISELSGGTIELHVTGRTLGGFGGNPYSNASGIARGLLHEPLHLTARYRAPISFSRHQELDSVARAALSQYGLGGGGCASGYGFPGC